MIDQNDIFAALQNGANPKELADKFAEALNAAVAQQTAENEKKNRHQEKIVRMSQLVDGLDAYVTDFYPDLCDGQHPIDAEMLVDIFDQAYEETMRVMPLLETFFKPVKEVAKAETNDGNALVDFLKKNGLA